MCFVVLISVYFIKSTFTSTCLRAGTSSKMTRFRASGQTSVLISLMISFTTNCHCCRFIDHLIFKKLLKHWNDLMLIIFHLDYISKLCSRTFLCATPLCTPKAFTGSSIIIFFYIWFLEYFLDLFSIFIKM